MKLRHLTTSALALIVMAACTDLTGVDDATDVHDETGVDDATAVEPTDLAGEWRSTEIILTSLEDNTLFVNLTTQDQAQVTLMLDAEGSYTFTFVSDVEPIENEAGVYTVVEGTLTTDPTGEKPPETWTISRNGDSMTLEGLDDYDFTPDNFVDVSAVLKLTR